MFAGKRARVGAGTARRAGGAALVVGAALLVPVHGCGSRKEAAIEAERATAKEEADRRHEHAAAASTAGNPGLPGPPGSTRAPTSTDKDVRRIEDHLFATDGGRVILKALRAQGGWERWRTVTRVTAAVRPAEGSPATPAAGGAPPAAPERQLAWTVPSPAEGLPPEDPLDLRFLTAPFWLANPALRHEYQGVEVGSGTGETYDKVRVFEERPGARWLIGYFNRRTGFLERFLYPTSTEVAPRRGPRFARVDFSEHREIDGLWLPGRWTTYFLEDRFSRLDLNHPAREEALVIKVETASSPASRRP